MEAYQVAVAALADRRGNQDEMLRMIEQRKARDIREQNAAALVGADLLPEAVEVSAIQF